MIKETQNKPEQERKAEKAVLSGRQKLLIRRPDYKNHRCDWNRIRGPDVVLVLSGLPKWQ